MRCAMCGHEFDATDLGCHTSCPLSADCAVVCCPRCGYSTVNPARSRLGEWVGRLFRRGASGTSLALDDPLPLLRLRPGQEARVVSLGHDDDDDVLHLSHFGLFPGAAVRLCQAQPVPIISIGETELALDRAVAAKVQVELL